MLLLLLLAAAPARAAETLTFIHTDVAGSPVAVTNQAGGVLWRESYRPYGERTVNDPAAAGNRPFFHGKAADPDGRYATVIVRIGIRVIGGRAAAGAISLGLKRNQTGPQSNGSGSN